MKMASMRNRVRAGVLLTLAMVVTLVFVMTHATPALSQTTDTDTVRISNLDEPSDGYVGISYDQEYVSLLREYVRLNAKGKCPPRNLLCYQTTIWSTSVEMAR